MTPPEPRCPPSCPVDRSVSAASWLWPAGCGTASIVSERLRSDIAINGSDEEWRWQEQFHDQKKDLAIKVLNDEDSVYLCFSTSDRELVKKLGTAGLTIWFDPKGGEKKSYGVRLPSEKRPRRFPFPKDGEPPVENRGHEINSMPFKPSGKVEILFAGDPNPVKMDAVEAGKSGVEFGAKCTGEKLSKSSKYRYSAKDRVSRWDRSRHWESVSKQGERARQGDVAEVDLRHADRL